MRIFVPPESEKCLQLFDALLRVLKGYENVPSQVHVPTVINKALRTLHL